MDVADHRRQEENSQSPFQLCKLNSSESFFARLASKIDSNLVIDCCLCFKEIPSQSADPKKVLKSTFRPSADPSQLETLLRRFLFSFHRRNFYVR